jgi:TRAP-type uncharacterized transport system fused permease subunit
LADDVDKWFALAGMIVLFEAARRTTRSGDGHRRHCLPALRLFRFVRLGPGSHALEGRIAQKAMSHMWITTEGVFGIALGVSTKFVFLFVLFGALLDKAGAGNYFIKMAFGAARPHERRPGQGCRRLRP